MVNGQCAICKNVNHTSIWKTFVQDGWFRGDDIYIGKFCKICKKNRKEDIEKYIEAKLGGQRGEEKKLV